MSNQTVSYKNFAYYYNQLIPINFYEKYSNKLKELGKFNDILDLACGSGTLCFLMKNETNQVTGLDLSQEMLMIAQEYNLVNKKGVYFINQNLNDLVLNSDSYDLITCTLDSLNYIEKELKLNKLIKNVSAALKNNGWFCFDILTQFYIDEIVSDHYQCEEFAEFEYAWHVQKIDKNVIKHDLSIVSEHNTYIEEHLQYVHDSKKMEKELLLNGLEIINKEFEYNELNSKLPSRVYYYVLKRGVLK